MLKTPKNIEIIRLIIPFGRMMTSHPTKKDTLCNLLFILVVIQKNMQHSKMCLKKLVWKYYPMHGMVIIVVYLLMDRQDLGSHIQWLDTEPIKYKF